MSQKLTERILKSTANGRRLAILKYLSGRDEATVGEIAEHIRLSLRSTSRHIVNLSSADLIERKQVGTAVFCSLARPVPGLISAILKEW